MGFETEVRKKRVILQMFGDNDIMIEAKLN